MTKQQKPSPEVIELLAPIARRHREDQAWVAKQVRAAVLNERKCRDEALADELKQWRKTKGYWEHEHSASLKGIYEKVHQHLVDQNEARLRMFVTLFVLAVVQMVTLFLIIDKLHQVGNS